MQPELIADVASTALQGVLGLICLLRGKGLAGWVHRMRYGAYTEAKPEA
ncbi:hypothetical protein [Lysobacter silvisoli]|nr:hypothetical protein [Lysobacter silvisoli]